MTSLLININKIVSCLNVKLTADSNAVISFWKKKLTCFFASALNFAVFYKKVVTAILNAVSLRKKWQISIHTVALNGKLIHFFLLRVWSALTKWKSDIWTNFQKKDVQIDLFFDKSTPETTLQRHFSATIYLFKCHWTNIFCIKKLSLQSSRIIHSKKNRSDWLRYARNSANWSYRSNFFGGLRVVMLKIVVLCN